MTAGREFPTKVYGGKAMMSDFRVTPFEMEMLLYYVRFGNDGGDNYKCVSPATLPLLEDTHDMLKQAGLIWTASGGVRWGVTEKGRTWIDMALSTPLPIQKLVRPLPPPPNDGGDHG